MREKKLRAGVDTYVAGCIRRAHACRAPYAVSPGAASDRAQTPPSPAALVGLPLDTLLPVSRASSSRQPQNLEERLEEEARLMEDALSSIADRIELSPAHAAPPQPPAWARAAFDAQLDRGLLCEHVAGALSSAAMTALAELPPAWQHALSVAATVGEWASVDAAILAQVATYWRLKGRGGGGSASSATPRQKLRKVVVVAWNFSLAVVPLAVAAAARALEGKYPGELVVMELHECAADELSEQMCSAVADRVKFNVYLHPAAVDMKDIFRGRQEQWAADSTCFLLLAAVPSPGCPAAERALEARAFLRQVCPLSSVGMLVFRRGGGSESPRGSEAALGPATPALPSEYKSPQAAWMLHRSPVLGPLRRVARPPAVTLPAGVRVPALRGSDGELLTLPPWSEVRRIVEARLFDMEPLSLRDQELLARMTQEDATGGRLLERAHLLALHGFAEWPQASLADSVQPCARWINTISGRSVPEGSFAAGKCGALRWCRECQAVCCAADSCVHPIMLIDAIVTVMEDALVAEPRASAASQSPRTPSVASAGADLP